MRYLSLLFLALFLCTCGPAQPETDTHTDTEDTVDASACEDLSPAEFAEKIGGPNTVLIDVRTPAETAGGGIPGALKMDYRSPEFKKNIGFLNSSKTYLLYCASGGRSAQACGDLSALGFEKVYNLRGGYAAWENK